MEERISTHTHTHPMQVAAGWLHGVPACCAGCSRAPVCCVSFPTTMVVTVHAFGFWCSDIQCCEFNLQPGPIRHMPTQQPNRHNQVLTAPGTFTT